MKRSAGIAALVAVLAAFPIAVARAADPSQAVILVASKSLDGSPFEQAVVIAAPVAERGYIGFIVNRPTTVKLETLFPDDASARNVNEPVYVGGPVLLRGVFALTRNAPDGAGASLELMPGVVAVLDGATVDRIIETTPNGARYFVGLMRWEPDELEDQIHNGLWEVRPADAQTVLPARTPGLWNSLRSPMASLTTTMARSLT
jgi:putative transcriptional regulator